MIKNKFNSHIIKLFLSGIAIFAFTVAHADATKEAIASKLPNVDASQIEKSPVENVYSVDLGERYAYVTDDAKYLFIGELIDMESGVNYTRMALGKKRIDTLKAIPEKNYIVFPAKDKKHSITVFTDIDCTWCRRMHSEIDDLNSLGIEVKYLLRPRSGQQSKSWQKADAVFCSKNKQKNLTRAKQGMDITMKTCKDSPVMENVTIAQKLGFMGTPVVLSENGTQLGGYVEANQLLEQLDAEKSKSGS